MNAKGLKNTLKSSTVGMPQAKPYNNAIDANKSDVVTSVPKKYSSRRPKSPVPTVSRSDVDPSEECAEWKRQLALTVIKEQSRQIESLQSGMEQLRSLLHQLEAQKTEMLFTFNEVNSENEALRRKLLATQREAKVLNVTCNDLFHQRDSLALELEKEKERTGVMVERVGQMAHQIANLSSGPTRVKKGKKKKGRALCVVKDRRMKFVEEQEDVLTSPHYPLDSHQVDAQFENRNPSHLSVGGVDALAAKPTAQAA